jgi:chorismate mutase/prephenate dehydratase
MNLIHDLRRQTVAEASRPPGAESTRLEEYRKAIDAIDSQLVKLLDERARVVVEVGKLKRETNSAVYAPSRESQVFRRAVEQSEGPLPPSGIRAIFREIISACISLEHPLTIAYLGPHSTFTHLAAQAKFGSSVEYLPNRDIAGIFRAVASGAADLGVVPVENSIDGGISDTLDAFMSYTLQICSEMIMEVHHCLMAPPGHKDIQRIYSKPQVFAQCGRWLGEHYPDGELISVSSTARACEIASGEAGAAAIAHHAAAANYGLSVVQENIEDVTRNVTRFVVLGRESCRPSGSDKTSVVLSVAHRSGALHEALEPFRDNGISLTRIESRPSKRNHWEYYFFIDFEGHQEDETVKKTLQKVHEACNYLQILGSYPIAESTVSIE